MFEILPTLLNEDLDITQKQEVCNAHYEMTQKFLHHNYTALTWNIPEMLVVSDCISAADLLNPYAFGNHSAMGSDIFMYSMYVGPLAPLSGRSSRVSNQYPSRDFEEMQKSAAYLRFDNNMRQKLGMRSNNPVDVQDAVGVVRNRIYDSLVSDDQIEGIVKLMNTYVLDMEDRENMVKFSISPPKHKPTAALASKLTKAFKKQKPPIQANAPARKYAKQHK